MIFAQFWMDVANLRGPASTDVISLQNQLRSLESQLRDKDAYINSLEKRSGPVSYARGDTVSRLNNLLDRCQTISSRMLDAICRSIPTWQSDVATVNEIREDVVCSLENVETIHHHQIARSLSSGYRKHGTLVRGDKRVIRDGSFEPDVESAPCRQSVRSFGLFVLIVSPLAKGDTSTSGNARLSIVSFWFLSHPDNPRIPATTRLCAIS